MYTPPDRTAVRMAIQAYAATLQHKLKDHLGVLTKYRQTGRSLHQPAFVQRQDPHVFIALKEERLPENHSPPQSEADLFIEWQQTGFIQPLLIVAPAGSGKSCLLEWLALQLVDNLMLDQTWDQTSATPPHVPLIIQLAKVVDCHLEDYLSQAESQLTHRSPSLTTDILQYLRNEGRLILLIDGFDEVPHAQERLNDEIQGMNCSFALTSRPGHGERHIVRDMAWHRTLQPLTLPQAREYVERYFKGRNNRRISTEHALMQLPDAWWGRLGCLLNRPLFLKSWCDSFDEHCQPARSPRDLAEQMLRTTLRTHPVLSQRGSHVSNAMDRFTNWFGRLGLSFIQNNREPTSRGTLEERQVLNIEGYQASLCGHPIDFVEVACKCGMLSHNKNCGEYSLITIPIVEYAIGRAAANDAVVNRLSPELLIEIVCHSIWEPKLHQVLDYTFDALWAGADADCKWALSLLQSLTEYARRDIYYHSVYQSPVGTPCTDDLLWPFASSALRWYFLNVNPTLDVVDSAVDCITELLSYIGPAIVSRAHITTDVIADAFLTPLIELLIDAYKTTRFKLDNEWMSAVDTIAGRTPRNTAVKIVERWIEKHANADIDASRMWEWAILSAIGRIPDSTYSKTVELWIKQNKGNAGYPPNAAPDIANTIELLKSYHHRESDPAIQQAWKRAICALERNEIPDTGQETLALLIWLDEQKGSSDELNEAIQAAASLVSEAHAEVCVELLTKKYLQVPDTSAQRAAWITAISRVALRIPCDRILASCESALANGLTFVACAIASASRTVAILSQPAAEVIDMEGSFNRPVSFKAVYRGEMTFERKFILVPWEVREALGIDGAVEEPTEYRLADVDGGTGNTVRTDVDSRKKKRRLASNSVARKISLAVPLQDLIARLPEDDKPSEATLTALEIFYEIGVEFKTAHTASRPSREFNMKHVKEAIQRRHRQTRETCDGRSDAKIGGSIIEVQNLFSACLGGEFTFTKKHGAPIVDLSNPGWTAWKLTRDYLITSGKIKNSD